jgi:magnesium transporter
VFDRLGDEIDDVQDAAIERPIPSTLEGVFRLKRELIRIRHVVAPSREVFAQLTSREFDLIAEPNVFYFRDVYDHLIRLNDELDSFRELVAGSLEIYLSTINNNLSVIMKRLTGVTVILAGIGAIGGLFGMSEAASALSGTEGSGFYLILIGTFAAAMLGVWFLRRIDWL